MTIKDALDKVRKAAEISTRENDICDEDGILIAQLLAIIEDQHLALQFYSNLKETKWVGCNGSHSQYSSMYDSDRCKICGADEDGPGNDIRQEFEHSLAPKAHAAIASTLERLGKLGEG